MSHFSFLCRTKTAAGTNALEHLPFDLTAMGAQKPMVIMDKSSHLAGLNKPLIRAFKESGMTMGFAPPLPENEDGGTDAAAQFLRSMYTNYNEKGFDAILALGGGPAADMAKALNIAVSLGPEALKGSRITAPLNPLVYIPTGVDTGAAAAGMTVFNNVSFSSPFLAPDGVVIDAKMIIPDDRETLLDYGLRNLAVGCEVHGLSGNPPARAYASTLIELSANVLTALIESGLDTGENLGRVKKEEKAWQWDLVQAAVISGYLMSGRRSLLSLALGREIASRSRISQGQVMAMVLPAILESTAGSGSGPLLLPLAGPDRFSSVPASQQARTAVQLLRDLVNTLHAASGGRLPRTLAEAGWNSEALDDLGHGLIEKDMLTGITPEVINRILTHACDGRPVS
ncbi:MAG: iron-containing alcohol dehydrogenase [Desulfobacterales bacterium]|nr:iron-containing alcohol dehydrogenase [Desulfobacterales bacterium]